MLNKLFTGRNGYLISFAGCFATVALALVIQTKYNLEPCPLCITQRMFFMGLGVLFLIGAFIKPASLLQKILTLLQDLNATFCISAYDLKPIKRLESVVVDEKYALHDVIETYSKEIEQSISYSENDENDVLFMDIDASNLSNRQIFELGFRYGQRTEFDKK